MSKGLFKGQLYIPILISDRDLFFRCNLHQFGEGVLRDKASGGCVLVLKVLGYLLFVILPFQCEGYI